MRSVSMLPANFRCIAEEAGPSRLSLQLRRKGSSREVIGEALEKAADARHALAVWTSMKGLASQLMSFDLIQPIAAVSVSLS